MICLSSGGGQGWFEVKIGVVAANCCDKHSIQLVKGRFWIAIWSRQNNLHHYVVEVAIKRPKSPYLHHLRWIFPIWCGGLPSTQPFGQPTFAGGNLLKLFDPQTALPTTRVGAGCVQRFHDSRSTCRMTYRRLLRSSSFEMPRHPLYRVVMDWCGSRITPSPLYFVKGYIYLIK